MVFITEEIKSSVWCKKYLIYALNRKIRFGINSNLILPKVLQSSLIFLSLHSVSTKVIKMPYKGHTSSILLIYFILYYYIFYEIWKRRLIADKKNYIPKQTKQIAFQELKIKWNMFFWLVFLLRRNLEMGHHLFIALTLHIFWYNFFHCQEKNWEPKQITFWEQKIKWKGRFLD